MTLSGDELDRIVYEVMRQYGPSSPIKREEVVQSALDYVTPRILQALERLVEKDLVDEERDNSQGGRPYTYHVPHK